MNSEAGPDRRGGITVAALRAFVAVVESGGFSAAAQRLGLSQPSVSAQVQNLEEASGLRLLHRRGKVEPTEEGRDLLLRARLVLARMEEFELAVTDIRGLRRGRLTVGFSTPIFAMPLLARFAAANPAVTLATRIGNTTRLLAEVAECRADVAVLTLADAAPALPAHFVAVRLARLRLGLCLAAGDPWAARRVLRFAELADQPVMLREAGSMTRALFETAAAEAGIAWRPGLEIGSREALKEAVAAGLGRGILLEHEVADDPALVFRPLRGPEALGAVHAVALRELAEAPAVAGFLALASEAAAQPAAGRRQRAT